MYSIATGFPFYLYIIRKTIGFGFSKRWVPFHKTTRIFFEGFSYTSFFALGSDSAPGSEFALGFGAVFLFVLSRCFVRSESVFCSF